MFLEVGSNLHVTSLHKYNFYQGDLDERLHNTSSWEGQPSFQEGQLFPSWQRRLLCFWEDLASPYEPGADLQHFEIWQEAGDILTIMFRNIYEKKPIKVQGVY